MDTQTLISLLQESLFVIVIFVAFLTFATIKGRQSLVNVIMGLYLALLVSVEFPYYDRILATSSTENRAVLMIFIFALFTLAATLLFSRLMPREYDEKILEGFGKKIILTTIATILVLTYSYHVLPITELLDPGPIQSLFAPEANFFWWLLLPLVVLFFI